MENFGSQFSEINFRKSIFGSPFSDVHFSEVQFSEVHFRKSIVGSPNFRKSIFKGTLFSEVHFQKYIIFGNPFWELIFRANCPHLRGLDLQIGELRTVRNYSDLSAEWCTSYFRQQGRVKRNNLRRPERSLSTTSRTRTLTPAPAPASSPGPKGGKRSSEIDKRSSEIASSSAAPYSPADSMNGQIEELNRNLEVVKEKRATIFDTSSWPRRTRAFLSTGRKGAGNGELRKLLRCWLKENGTSSATKNDWWNCKRNQRGRMETFARIKVQKNRDSTATCSGIG